jgi:ribosomal protein S18 acetylase RimI-like enzyme
VYEKVFPLRSLFSKQVFGERLARLNVQPRFSVVAYCGEEPVGFMLHGMVENGGVRSAYNAGTGLLPAWRGQGLCQQMFRFVAPMLAAVSISSVLLEVEEGNQPAIRAYQKIGFVTGRKLQGYQTAPALPDAKPLVKINLLPQAYPDFTAYLPFWDTAPGWQASPGLLANFLQEYTFLEAYHKQTLVGHLVLDPTHRLVVQMGVAPAWRRKYIGTTLLRAAQALVKGQPLYVLFVEESHPGLAGFFHHTGARLIFRQWEMQLSLGNPGGPSWP